MDDMMFTSGNATSGGAQQVSEESGLVRYTRRELTLIGEGDDPMQVEMNENVLQMVKIFASQGHSGFSASYLLAVLDRVMRFMPLTPLTGDESEWTDTEDGAGTDQNNRCSAVFRRNNDNSTAYYLYGKEFSDDDGKTWHHTKNSRVPVCFPYSPPYEAEKIMLPNGRRTILLRRTFMSTGAPVVVCYRRDKKFYWSIKSKGYDTEEEAIAAMPSREKNKVYNGNLVQKTKGEKGNGKNGKK